MRPLTLQDIFAGMDLTLRGNGRNIVHREHLDSVPTLRRADLSFFDDHPAFAMLVLVQVPACGQGQRSRLQHSI